MNYIPRWNICLKLTKKNREMTTCSQPIKLGNTRIIPNYAEKSPGFSSSSEMMCIWSSKGEVVRYKWRVVWEGVWEGWAGGAVGGDGEGGDGGWRGGGRERGRQRGGQLAYTKADLCMLTSDDTAISLLLPAAPMQALPVPSLPFLPRMPAKQLQRITYVSSLITSLLWPLPFSHLTLATK